MLLIPLRSLCNLCCFTANICRHIEADIYNTWISKIKIPWAGDLVLMKPMMHKSRTKVLLNREIQLQQKYLKVFYEIDSDFFRFSHLDTKGSKASNCIICFKTKGSFHAASTFNCDKNCLTSRHYFFSGNFFSSHLLCTDLVTISRQKLFGNHVCMASEA